MHIRGDARVRLHTVNMAFCNSVTDAAFVYLRGIHTLDMSSGLVGGNEKVTDAAFVHLRGIHTLNMSCCNQNTITNAAFVNLRGIHTLDMSLCDQDTITGSTFTHLRGIRDLRVDACSATIKAAAAALLALPAL